MTSDLTPRGVHGALGGGRHVTAPCVAFDYVSKPAFEHSLGNTWGTRAAWLGHGSRRGGWLVTWRSQGGDGLHPFHLCESVEGKSYCNYVRLRSVSWNIIFWWLVHTLITHNNIIEVRTSLIQGNNNNLFLHNTIKRIQITQVAKLDQTPRAPWPRRGPDGGQYHGLPLMCPVKVGSGRGHHPLWLRPYKMLTSHTKRGVIKGQILPVIKIRK